MQVVNESSEIFEEIQNFPYTVIRLKDQFDKTIVPFPSKSSTIDVRKKQVKNFIDAENTKPGIYILEYGSTRGDTHKMKFKLSKGVNPETLQEIPEPKKDQMDISDLDQNPTLKNFIDIQIQNARLEFENQYLKRENERLLSKIDELENEIDNFEPLEEEKGGQFGFLKDLLPSLADAYFENEKQKRQNEQAEIGLKYRQVQPQQENINHRKKAEGIEVEPTKEGIEKFKREHPELWNEFYERNQQQVEALLNQETNE